MFALIMVRQAQRQSVSLPTNALSFRIGNHTRRMWQYNLARRQTRTFRAERHLQLLFRTGKRARRLRKRALEEFRGRFLGDHRGLISRLRAPREQSQ